MLWFTIIWRNYFPDAIAMLLFIFIRNKGGIHLQLRRSTYCLDYTLFGMIAPIPTPYSQ